MGIRIADLWIRIFRERLGAYNLAEKNRQFVNCMILEPISSDDIFEEYYE